VQVKTYHNTLYCILYIQLLYRSSPHPAAIVRTIRLLIMHVLYRAFRTVILVHQMSFNDKIEALRRRMDGGGAGHQQQRAAGNDRRIDNDSHSRIAQQLAASGLIIHTISIVLNIIMTRQ
jgi:hypothetical protein